MLTKTPSLKQITPEDYADSKRFLSLLNDFVTSSTNAWQAQPRTIVRDVAIRAPERWIGATLAAPWGNVSGYDGVGYWMDPTRRVWLRGVASLGTYGPLPIFTLPVGYRPESPQPLAAVQSNATFAPAGQITVLPTGDVIASPITSVQTGISTFLSFAGLSFEATGPVPVLSPLPLTVDVLGLVGSPSSVVVLDCEDVTTPTPVPCAVSVAWDLALVNGAQVVRLTQVNGLTAGRLYRLRLEIGTR